MSLVPKISVIAIDKIHGQTITLQDTTGAYNAGTNPSGYGTPNIATTDLDWAVLLLRNYKDTNYTVQKLSSLTNILGSGQNVSGIVDGRFPDGVWELKYYPVVGNPVTPNIDTTVNWQPGGKNFTLGFASTVLAGATAILIKDISDTKLYFLDPAIPPDNISATVTEVLPAAGTGLVAVAYQADTRFLEPAAADDCLAIDTGKIIRDCSCFDPHMQELFLRMGKRQGADIHMSQTNYQAAHNIITQLAAICETTNSNCGCK